MNTNQSQQPTVEQILSMMKENMNGALPKTMELAGEVMPEMVLEQARSSEFAMPKENGAIDAESRTLIHLGIALATNSTTCIESLMNKAEVQKISKEKIIETLKIARFAESARVVGNAEVLLRNLK